jgi:[ribosomal protein S18]-alanine N-acetyltransferase
LTVWPAALVVRPWTADDTDVVAGWRYIGPWAVYNGPDPFEATDGYRAVVSATDEELIGYYCVGPEARVTALEPDDTVVDVGVGMNPDWVGKGHGADFLCVVLEDVRRAHPATPLRTVIQTWNMRSVRLAQRLGFVVTGTHRCVQDGRQVEYTVAVLAANRS